MNNKERSPLLSGRLEWISHQILILFVATIIYTIVIWFDESKTQQSTILALKNTMKEAVSFFQYAAIVVIGCFEAIGEFMIRYTMKIREALKQGVEIGVKQGREEGREEGRAKGREEIYEQWFAYYERMKEAEQKGIEFNEPPPPKPNNSHL